MKTYPVCINRNCEDNDPGYPAQCDYFVDVKNCEEADIEYRETHLSRAIAWLRKYFFGIFLILAILAVILFDAYIYWIAFTTGEFPL